MTNEQEIVLAQVIGHIPGGKTILKTGIRLESESSARIKQLLFENKLIRKELDRATARASGREIVMEEQSKEIAQLRAERAELLEKLGLRDQQLHQIAEALQEFVNQKDDEVKAAKRDSKSAQEALHRMWNSRLAGEDK